MLRIFQVVLVDGVTDERRTIEVKAAGVTSAVALAEPSVSEWIFSVNTICWADR